MNFGLNTGAKQRRFLLGFTGGSAFVRNPYGAGGECWEAEAKAWRLCGCSYIKKLEGVRFLM